MRFTRITTLAGLAGGGATAAWTLFEFLMGWHGPRQEIGARTGFVALAFPLAAILWALRATRRELHGRLSFGQAFQAGAAVTLWLTGLGLLFYLLYYTVINPGFLTQMQASGTPTSLAEQLLTVGIGSLGFGLVISAIGAVVMRSRDDR